LRKKYELLWDAGIWLLWTWPPKWELHGKMSKGNFSEDDMKKIADLLDCDYEGPTLKMRDTGEEI
jgi:hypothetical protein